MLMPTGLQNTVKTKQCWATRHIYQTFWINGFRTATFSWWTCESCDFLFKSHTWCYPCAKCVTASLLWSFFIFYFFAKLWHLPNCPRLILLSDCIRLPLKPSNGPYAIMLWSYWYVGFLQRIHPWMARRWGEKERRGAEAGWDDRLHDGKRLWHFHSNWTRMQMCGMLCRQY